MKNRLGKLFLSTIIIYLILIGLLFLLNPKADIAGFKEYSIKFLGSAFIGSLPFYLNAQLNLNYNYIALGISLLWAFCNPLLEYLSYKISDPQDDLTSGCLIFTLLIIVKEFCKKYLPNKLANLSIILLQNILLLPPLGNMLCYLLYQHPVSIKLMLAIQQTNLAEAKEFLQTVPVSSFIFAGLFFLCSISLSSYELHKDKYAYKTAPPNLPLLIVKLTLIAFILIPGKNAIIKRTNFIDCALQAHNYFKYLEEYKTDHQKVLNRLQVTHTNNSTPQTIILVIGESASRDYLHIYSNIPEENTPWLDSKKDDFLIFNNAYSSAESTIISLEHALTEANFYNKKSFVNSISIIDIAKKAGYKTYWFSNQNRIGIFDTPITLIAENSDTAVWNASELKYDEALLPLMQNINKNENNFIIFHLTGSHAYFTHRYPPEYQLWSHPHIKGGVEDYKNTIAYTDHVLKEIFTYAQENFNLASLVYFSDHGHNPQILRDPDNADFVSLRIPFFIYFSPDYTKQNPEITSTLQKNTYAAFSNDLIYNLLCSIFNVQSPNFEEDESLASTKYKFDFSTIKTDFGKKHPADDPQVNRGK